MKKGTWWPVIGRVCKNIVFRGEWQLDQFICLWKRKQKIVSIDWQFSEKWASKVDDGSRQNKQSQGLYQRLKLTVLWKKGKNKQKLGGQWKIFDWNQENLQRNRIQPW